MPWVAAEEYSARIGGLTYRNVLQPITLDDEPLISLHRNSKTGLLVPSFALHTQDGVLIGRVVYGELEIADPARYIRFDATSRIALVEASTGQVWCDIRTAPVWQEYELDVSCTLFVDSGYPIFLHPNRSKFGKANDGDGPNISGIGFTYNGLHSGSAVGIKINSGVYLLDVAIENFRTGIAIRRG